MSLPPPPSLPPPMSTTLPPSSPPSLITPPSLTPPPSLPDAPLPLSPLPVDVVPEEPLWLDEEQPIPPAMRNAAVNTDRRMGNPPPSKTSQARYQLAQRSVRRPARRRARRATGLRDRAA